MVIEKSLVNNAMMRHMNTAILIHGWPGKEEYFDPKEPSPSNNHWFPWLQHQLLIKSILTQTPEMPDAWEPRYEKWKKTFEQFTLNEDTALIGHSCGAGFLVRWLSETTTKVGHVVLVAPWMDPHHEERESIADFFDFTIDPDLSTRTSGVTVFISEDDEPAMLETVSLLEQSLKGVEIKRFSGKGHFTIGDMGTEEFPELLEEVLKHR